MTNLKYNAFENCEVISDLTPKRKNRDKIYLCKCQVCGNTFTRCRKTLMYHHSDCGCISHNSYRAGIYTDKLISDMDKLSKKVFLAKLEAIGIPYTPQVFKALYIDEKTYGEYTALSLGMSMATLYRTRKTIHKLWSKLKNDLMV